MKRFYLDANATYGMVPEVAELLSSCADISYWNPNAVHHEGQSLRARIDRIRNDLYEVLSCSEKEYSLIFNSGATEGNNSTLLFPFLKREHSSFSGNIVITTVEHSSVLGSAERLEQLGVEVRRIPPQESDDAFIDAVKNAVDADTRLVSIMWANNETGQVFPVAKLFTELRAAHPELLLHTDGVQAVGKCVLDLSSFPFDFFTCSAHKFGALPGVGIMVQNRRLEHCPMMIGGAQEQRWRPGTENSMGILSLGAVIPKLRALSTESLAAIQAVRDEFEEKLLGLHPDLQIMAEKCERLPNTSFVYFPGIRSDDLVVALDLAGVSCSVGSACASGKQLGSTTIRGMNLSEDVARGVVRFSFRDDFDQAELDDLVSRVSSCVERAHAAGGES